MTEVKPRNRVTIGKDNKPVFFLDNKRVSRDKYEETLGPYEDPVEPVKENTSDDCPFCGKPGTHTKFVHLKLVKLCENHYLNKTTGEIAEVMRNL